MRDERHPYYRSIEGVDQLAVGWLGRDCPSTALPRQDLVEKLALWIATQKFPSAHAGFYTCALPRCPDDKGDGWAAGGSGEIYVPHVSKLNTLFCAPALVRHYVAAHGYSPPVEFIESVLACPIEDVPRFDCRIEEVPPNLARPEGPRLMAPGTKPVRMTFTWLNKPGD